MWQIWLSVSNRTNLSCVLSWYQLLIGALWAPGHIYVDFYDQNISKAFTQNSLWPRCDINWDHLAPLGQCPWHDLTYDDISWPIIVNNEVSRHIAIHDISIADIFHHSHYRQWCTLFKPVPFLHKNAGFLPLLANLAILLQMYALFDVLLQGCIIRWCPKIGIYRVRIYHYISCHIMTYQDKSWHIATHHDISWHFMIYHCQ